MISRKNKKIIEAHIWEKEINLTRTLNPPSPPIPSIIVMYLQQIDIFPKCISKFQKYYFEKLIYFVFTFMILVLFRIATKKINSKGRIFILQLFEQIK